MEPTCSTTDGRLWPPPAVGGHGWRYWLIQPWALLGVDKGQGHSLPGPGLLGGEARSPAGKLLAGKPAFPGGPAVTVSRRGVSWGALTEGGGAVSSCAAPLSDTGLGPRPLQGCVEKAA